MGIRGGLGLGVRKERIILRYTMIRTGAEVRHHHEPSHTRLRGRIDHPDRRVPVDGIGARRVATTGSGGEDDRVVADQQIGQRVRVELLDIGDHWAAVPGHASRDVVGVVGVAEDRSHLVAALGEDAGQLQCDLAVATDDDDACHTNRRYCPYSFTRPMIRSMMGLPGGYAPVSDAIVCP